MNRSKAILILLSLIVSAAAAFAQGGNTGGIKGKVRVKNQGPTADVSVTVKQGEREVAHAVTDSKGEFLVTGLAPGVYGITLRKTGLSVGTLEDINVKAGKTTQLPDRLVLTVNEASIARLWSSVFNEGGYSIPNVRVELARLQADGTTRKIDGRLTNESGQAVFRLSPDKATYRLTVKADGAEPQSKDVEIDGAMVYRVAFTIGRAPK
ncbi:MAG TPA: carboxypeptidase regulatory-like domain-containing protein [Pyrinomonadaceae bacterium]|nr:carboxypeptidase regulatory-like domain-containing protein [Pyrinomonadaceae bacterium]